MMELHWVQRMVEGLESTWAVPMEVMMDTTMAAGLATLWVETLDHEMEEPSAGLSDSQKVARWEDWKELNLAVLLV